MAITIWLGKTDKRRNSTLVPLSTVFSEEVSCVLKEACSDYTPVFLLKHSDPWGGLNYLKWDDRYYFIDDVVYEANELFSVHCTMDLLASFKSEILANQAFVLYDTVGNSEIVDKRLSVKSTCTTVENNGTLRSFEAGYSIILGIVGKFSTGVYAFTASECQALMNEINTWQNNSMPVPNEPQWDPDPTDLSKILQNVGESIFEFADALRYYFRQLVATGKAPDCIKSALIVPVPPEDFPGTTISNVRLGDYDTQCSGKLLTPTGKAFSTCTIAVPWQASDWRKNSPYHEFYLRLPYVGLVHIPASQLTDCNSVDVSVTISYNGGCDFSVAKTGGAVIGKYITNCSSSFLIGSSNVSQLTTASNFISAAGTAAAAVVNPGIGIAAGAAMLVGTMGNLQPVPSSVSGGGGIAFSSSGVCDMYSIFHDTTITPSSVGAVMGIPSMQVKTLSALTGYVQTLNASISCNANASETQKINDLLDGGIYIE